MKITKDLAEIGLVEFYTHPRAKHYRLTLRSDQSLRVTIPKRGTLLQAEKFVHSRQDWIARQRAKRPVVTALSTAEIARLRAEAKGYIPERVQVLAAERGFSFGTIRIKNMTSRWGSCSAKKNLNFSLHLMRLESIYIDYVIWHELCHTQQMNHGPKFWALLESVCPGARELDRAMRRLGMSVG